MDVRHTVRNAVEPIVETDAGRVRGIADEGGAAFLGIPFAAPPVGRRRLAAPAPVEPWSGVRDAREHGPTAVQPEQGFTLIPEPVVPGDDCLNLNVFTPDPGAGGLPVLVWIHGGGFVSGCNRSPWYRGSRFARDGVVVVAVNYRLGVEGFAAVEGAPPNRGVLDWLAALAWVQRNIAAFGGDPARVTVGGQSAGAAAAVTLLTMPRAGGLFDRVLAMSGTAVLSRSYDEALDDTRRVAAELGVPATRDGLAGVQAAQVMTTERRLATERRGTAGGLAGGVAAGPLVDGDLIPERPLDALARGVGADRALLLGTTAEEVNPALALAADRVDEARLRRRLARMGLGDGAARSYRDDLPAGAAPWQVLAAAVTDQIFRLPAARTADARAGAAAGTFAYEFRWRSPALGGVGAAHCVDLPFAWDLLDADHVPAVLGEAPPGALAERMHRHWVDFVTAGDPGWPAYEPGSRRVMALDDESEVLEDPLAARRAIWDGVDGAG